jgi:hypothetical protein
MAGAELDTVVSKLIDAEQLIDLGHYSQAMRLYREMLIDDPGNKRILQRKAELAALIKLLGKGNENIINKLNRFLEAIRIHYSAEA